MIEVFLMILDIYKDSFEYAGQDVKTILKLGVLYFLSFFIIPIFLVAGYQYRVIGAGINGMIGGDDKLPSFDNITGMFVDGIKYILVQIGYLIVPGVVFVISMMLSVYSDAASILAFVVGIILFIISELYMFIAIPNMIANDGSLKAAFKFKRLNEIIKMIGLGEYIMVYVGVLLLVTVISLVVAFIFIMVSSIFGIAIAYVAPSVSMGVLIVTEIILGFIFSFVVGPYLGIFAGRATGLIYGVGE